MPGRHTAGEPVRLAPTTKVSDLCARARDHLSKIGYKGRNLAGLAGVEVWVIYNERGKVTRVGPTKEAVSWNRPMTT